jgi:tellurite resistance protein TerC
LAQVHAPFSFWLIFNAVVLALLMLDLAVLDRGDAPASMRRSILTTLGWIGLAALFALWILHQAGAAKALEFTTGYLIEYALSMDNLFLFVLLFGTFRIAARHQHRLLFWGVLGALLMRGAMILAGTALLARFDWLIYVFGAYLLCAGIFMLRKKPESEVESLWIVRATRRLLPLSDAPDPRTFTVLENGRRHATLLLLVLLVIEFTDLVFALDSIPAVFGVTTDPFIVYTSNVCAVLGLRSLYFVLAAALKSLVYLPIGLALVLIFIGGKMVLGPWVPIGTVTSLLVTAAILAGTVGASLAKNRRLGA